MAMPTNLTPLGQQLWQQNNGYTAPSNSTAPATDWNAFTGGQSFNPASLSNLTFDGKWGSYKANDGNYITQNYSAMPGTSRENSDADFSGGQLTGYSSYDGKPWYEGQEESRYDTNGNFLDKHKLDESGQDWVSKYGWIIPAIFSGGAAAGFFGGGAAAAGEGLAGAAAGAGAGSAAGAAEMAGAGLSFGAPMGTAATSAYGGLAGAVSAADMAAAMGMSPEAFTALGTAGVGAAGAGAGQLAGTAAGSVTPAAGGAAGSATGGLGSVNIPGIGNVSYSQLGSLANTLSQLSSGGGGATNTGAGANGAGAGLGGLIPLLGGLYGGQQQGQAANQMKSWLQSQQAKIDNLYNPDTPEYNALWDQMSRKDAAAGRNSQYGPRSVDLAARIAQIKADETQRFTTGTSKAYADSLNQNASKYSGLMSALGSNNIGSLANSGLGGLAQLLNGSTGGPTASQLAQGSTTGAANDLTSARDYAGVSDADWANYLSSSGAADPFSIFW